MISKKIASEKFRVMCLKEVWEQSSSDMQLKKKWGWTLEMGKGQQLMRCCNLKVTHQMEWLRCFWLMLHSEDEMGSKKMMWEMK